MKSKLFTILVVCAAVLAARPMSGRAAEKFDFGLSFWAKDDPKNREDLIPWQKVLFEIKNNLGDARQFNFFEDACYAGIAKYRSDPNQNGGIDLGIPYTLAMSNTAVNATTARKMYFDSYSLSDPPPDGRPNADDNRRLKLGDDYYYSFDNYLTKKLKTSDGTLTVKQLYDAAKADVLADPVLMRKSQMPDFVARGGGDQDMALKGGQNGFRARTVVFGRDTSGMYAEPAFEEYRALNAIGFDSMAFYRNGLDADPQHNPPILGKGTWANFKGALGTLKTQLADDLQNKFQTVVNLFDVGHGTNGAKFDGRLGNQLIVDPAPGEGYVLNGSDATVGIPMDTDYWNTLKVGLIPPPPDADDADKDLIRIHQPRFSLAFSQQSLTEEFSVSIGASDADPGILLGTFAPPEDPSGTFTLEISDSTLLQLISSYDGLSRLVLHFNFGAGDWVRVGVLEDLLYSPDYLSYTYGTGLDTVVAGVPEPTTLTLLILGGFGVASRRRRR